MPVFKETTERILVKEFKIKIAAKIFQGILYRNHFEIEFVGFLEILIFLEEFL